MEQQKITIHALVKKCIKQCAAQQHRSLFTICGRNADKQVYVINHFVSKSLKTQSILWCHETSSDSITLKKKQIRRVEKKLKNGETIDITQIQENFLASSNIKFCSYDNTTSALGNSYNMCVLQDVHCITPNKLCHVVETVRGGGAVLFLLPELKSIDELRQLSMSIHSKYKTSTNPTSDMLYMKRFVTSFSWCISSAMLDDELQLCENTKPPRLPETVVPYEKTNLDELLSNLDDVKDPLDKLLPICSTLDQTNVLTKIVDVLNDPNTRTTVSITASRGRGKSAILGLGVAAAIHSGLGNIFVVAPSPQNLQTFFEFLLKGFDALELEENTHYQIYQSTNEEFSKSIISVCVFKSSKRQYIQYLDPCDHRKMSHAQLVIIDEAAAIPLVHVKALFGPYNVFMASTISGYEGTGRALSLKLLEELRKESIKVAAGDVPGRRLHELTMETSIRYAPNDPVEHWINKLLCLEATSYAFPVDYLAAKESCELYYVNKNMLFNGSRHSEELLKQVISLLVASHYKNAPDDLQLLADNPAHHLLVLTKSLPSSGKTSIPCIYTVIQVCFEGGIDKCTAKKVFRQGSRASGDMVPWTLARTFLDPKLAQLKSVRIVRVATQPGYQSFGYGSRAISLLEDYFSGKMNFLGQSSNLGESDTLLSDLSERVPENLDYIGVSFGMSQRLFKFWSKCAFHPLHISNAPNAITGEHNCVMVLPLASEDTGAPQWFRPLPLKFMHTFVHQLKASLSDIPTDLAVNIVDCYRRVCDKPEIKWEELEMMTSNLDLKLIQSYMNNISERTLITHLLPTLAEIFFLRMLPEMNLSMVQARLLIGTGLQRRSVEHIVTEMDQSLESILGQFKAGIGKIGKNLLRIRENDVKSKISETIITETRILPVNITEEMEDPAFEETKLPFESDLRQYAINDLDDTKWSQVVHDDHQAPIVTIKSKKRARQMTDKELEKQLEQPTKKKHKFKRK